MECLDVYYCLVTGHVRYVLVRVIYTTCCILKAILNPRIGCSLLIKLIKHGLVSEKMARLLLLIVNVWQGNLFRVRVGPEIPSIHTLV